MEINGSVALVTGANRGLAAVGGGAIVNMLSITSFLHQPLQRVLRCLQGRGAWRGHLHPATTGNAPGLQPRAMTWKP